jgi:hypothetical protein
MSRAIPLPDPARASPDRKPFGDLITPTLVGLARVSKADRVLVTGSLGTELLVELHRRGCTRVATAASCGLPHGQYDAALVAWHRHSLKALETTLDWLVHFLNPRGMVAVWVGRDEDAADRKLRSMLDRLGFRLEAGTACENGLAVAARRLESVPAKAA